MNKQQCLENFQLDVDIALSNLETSGWMGAVDADWLTMWAYYWLGRLNE